MTFPYLETPPPEFAVDMERDRPAYATGRERGYVSASLRDNGRRRRRWRAVWPHGDLGTRHLIHEAWSERFGTTQPMYVWLPSRDRNLLTDSHDMSLTSEWEMGCDYIDGANLNTLIATEMPSMLNPFGGTGGVFRLEVGDEAVLYGCLRKAFTGLYTLGPHNSVHDTGRVSALQTVSCFFSPGDAPYFSVNTGKRAGGPPVAYGPVIDASDYSIVEMHNSQPGETVHIEDWGNDWVRVGYTLPGLTTSGANDPTIGTARQIWIYPIENPAADPQPTPAGVASLGVHTFLFGPQLEEGGVMSRYQPTLDHSTRVLARFTGPPRVTQLSAAQFSIEADFEEVV
jgi:hypothetical protein